MQYTKIPSIIDNLVYRLSVKATEDGYTAIVNKLTILKPITWFNLPYQLNKIMGIIKEYQVELDNSELQTKIDSIGKIYWFEYFKKVSELIATVELIESL